MHSCVDKTFSPTMGLLQMSNPFSIDHGGTRGVGPKVPNPPDEAHPERTEPHTPT